MLRAGFSAALKGNGASHANKSDAPAFKQLLLVSIFSSSYIPSQGRLSDLNPVVYDSLREGAQVSCRLDPGLWRIGGCQA